VGNVVERGQRKENARQLAATRRFPEGRKKSFYERAFIIGNNAGALLSTWEIFAFSLLILVRIPRYNSRFRASGRQAERRTG
jgi:hypothetical protein